MEKKQNTDLVRSKNPHDDFFKTMMENIEVATDFFKAYLHPNLKGAVDWSTLKMDESARKGHKSKSLYTDITYVCKTLDKTTHVYLHVEQERGVDPTMLPRHLQYNAALMMRHRKQGNKKLPLIFNITLYNGKRKKYPYYEDIFEYFESPELARDVMFKSFSLVHLQNKPNEELLKHGYAGLMELLLKGASDRGFVKVLREIKSLEVKFLPKIIFESLVHYILNVGKDDIDDLTSELLNLFPEKKDTVMTAGQQLVNRGILQGRQEGIIDTARNMMYKLGLGIDAVQKATNLDRATLEKLKKEVDKN